ncbi:hypothetical protein SCUP515_11946 [Seiridium cupressi]
MKLIVVGSTGFVASEIIRQAVSLPDVTSIYALGRREISAPPSLGPEANASKLKSVILEDFDRTIAVSPSKLKSVTWEQTCKISRDYAIKGIDVISHLPRKEKTKPLRFIYTSRANAERDQSKKPLILGDYCLMRDAENKILAYARESNGKVEACAAKAGIIEDPNNTPVLTKMGRIIIRTISGLPKITVGVISAALLDQALRGFEKDTITNEDMIRVGERILAARK